ncbi:MAG TPA: MBL fold metallo-hydrolase [Firmicutes bacterium]|jgi:hydroxyacylglutathione hydrolase|nr:MBL fold metallo-hydrolase [Bacillota bacterium]
MQLERFVLNAYSTNCYVLYDGGEAVIVDPGGEAPKILEFLEQEKLQVVLIVNTHGHCDHIIANAWFMEKTQAPLAIHSEDAPFLTDPRLNLGEKVRMEVHPVKADRLLVEGEKIAFGSASLQVIHTPGHTPGGICLYGDCVLISGDTLFRSSVGRWDFPGSDELALKSSLRRLTQLPPETKIYPGHGFSTTLERELAHNPFLKSLQGSD